MNSKIEIPTEENGKSRIMKTKEGRKNAKDE